MSNQNPSSASPSTESSERRPFSASEHLARSAKAIRDGHNPFDGAAGAEKAFQSLSAAGKSRLLSLPLHLITMRDSQARSKANERVRLDELRELIKEHGFNSAILVIKVGERFEIVAGHRRFLAAREAQVAEIPCIVLENQDEYLRIKAQVTENTARLDLFPVELGETYARMMEARPGAEQKDVAADVKLSPQRFGDLLKLARLPSAVKEALNEKKVPEQAAVTIAALYEMYRTKMPKEESAIERTVTIIARSVRDGWSVRRLKMFVQSEKERLGAARRAKRAAKADGASDQVGAPAAGEGAGAGATTDDSADGLGLGGEFEGNGGSAAPLYVRDARRLIVNLELLESGGGTAEECGALERELTSLLASLRRGVATSATG